MKQLPLELATTQQIINELQSRKGLEYVIIAIRRHDPYYCRLAYSHSRDNALKLLEQGAEFLEETEGNGEQDKPQW